MDIPTDGVKLYNKLIKDIVLPSKDKLLENKELVFENCIFVNKCDLNFHDFNSNIRFHNCKDLVMDEVKLLSKDISVANNTMKIFLSYCWKDESIADSVEKTFNEKGINLVRDLRYKSSIKEFMKPIRKGDFSFIIISEDYLKSLNCMYEMGEFIKDESYKDRILLIVKKGTNIFNAIGRLEYSIYW